jgi:hypothetical protein
MVDKSQLPVTASNASHESLESMSAGKESPVKASTDLSVHAWELIASGATVGATAVLGVLGGAKALSESPNLAAKVAAIFGKSDFIPYQIRREPEKLFDPTAKLADRLEFAVQNLSANQQKSIIALEKHPEVLIKLASNGSLKPDLLPKLLEKVNDLPLHEQEAFLKEVLESLLSKKDLAAEVQAKVLESVKDLTPDQQGAVLKGLASTKELAPEAQAKVLESVKGLTHNQQGAVLTALARNSDLATEVQAQLLELTKPISAFYQDDILMGLVSNKSLTPQIQAEVLQQVKGLTPNQRVEVLRGLASNESLTPQVQAEVLEIAKGLTPNQQGAVLKGLASGKSLATEVQAQFLEQVKRLSPDERGEVLTSWLAWNSGSRLPPEVQAGALEQVKLLSSDDARAKVLQMLAANSDLNPEVQVEVLETAKGLKSDQLETVLKSLELHGAPEVQAEVLELVKGLKLEPTFLGEHLRMLASNERLAPEVQAELLELVKPISFYNGEVLRMLAGSSDLAPEVQNPLLEQAKVLPPKLKDEVFKALESNEKFKPEGKVQSPEDVKIASTGHIEPPPQPPVNASAANSELSLFGKAAKVITPVVKFMAPVGLAALPVIEGVVDGYQEYRKGGSALETTESALGGLGKGILDTYLPSARNYYSDVTGGKRTGFDRFLNAANDVTATGFAVGATATVVETAGVISIPATIPTAIATGVAGLSNFGINAIIGIVKVTGLAGQDQDGGYIYDGAKLAVDGAEYLLGVSAKE